MVGNSLLTQIVIAAIAIGIVITYIQPKLGEIKDRQDEIKKTQDEVKKVADVNARLAELYAQLNAIPQRDREALTTYLPDQVDEVQVLKDLSQIAADANIKLRQISYEGESGVPTSIGSGAMHAWTFAFGFDASYEKVKDLLSYLERNHYPLTVESMSVSPLTGGELSVDLKIVTYSLKGKK